MAETQPATTHGVRTSDNRPRQRSGRNCECCRARAGELGAAVVCGGWLVSPARPGSIEKYQQLIARGTHQLSTVFLERVYEPSDTPSSARQSPSKASAHVPFLCHNSYIVHARSMIIDGDFSTRSNTAAEFPRNFEEECLISPPRWVKVTGETWLALTTVAETIRGRQ